MLAPCICTVYLQEGVFVKGMMRGENNPELCASRIRIYVPTQRVVLPTVTKRRGSAVFFQLLCVYPHPNLFCIYNFTPEANLKKHVAAFSISYKCGAWRFVTVRKREKLCEILHTEGLL